MKKDLKEAILGIEVTQFDGQKADLEELVNPKQLEEIISDWMPEVLTQEWIVEHEMPISWMAKEQKVVRVDHLQSLLAPKQELPSVPQSVAEWYESEGKRSSWWNWFYKWGRDESRTELESKAIRWMQDFNEEAFVNMFLHGYTVDKEQKYYVLNNEGETMIRKDDSGVRTSSGFKIDNRFKNEDYKFTEQEIKDYDERYFAFAVKVKELEE